MGSTGVSARHQISNFSLMTRGDMSIITCFVSLSIKKVAWSIPVHQASPNAQTTEIANQATDVTDQLTAVVSLNFGDFGETAIS